MGNSDTQEVKSGFTWKYLTLTLLIALLSAALGFGSTYILQIVTKDTKEVFVSITSSGNLATIPVSASNNIEVYLTLSNNQKRLVRSLFRYDATITNTSEEGIDNFTVFVSVPPTVSLVAQPQVTSNPPEIIDTINNETIENQPNKQVYRVNLLNQDQSLTYSYFAYADEIIEPPIPSVIVQKKDWTQEVVSQSQAASTKSESVTIERDQLTLILLPMMALLAVVLAFMMMLITTYLRSRLY